MTGNRAPCSSHMADIPLFLAIRPVRRLSGLHRLADAVKSCPSSENIRSRFEVEVDATLSEFSSTELSVAVGVARDKLLLLACSKRDAARIRKTGGSVAARAASAIVVRGKQARRAGISRLLVVVFRRPPQTISSRYNHRNVDVWT